MRQGEQLLGQEATGGASAGVLVAQNEAASPPILALGPRLRGDERSGRSRKRPLPEFAFREFRSPISTGALPSRGGFKRSLVVEEELWLPPPRRMLQLPPRLRLDLRAMPSDQVLGPKGSPRGDAGLSRGDLLQRAGGAQFHVEVGRIEVEAVRPGRRSQFDEDPGEIGGRLQRLHHLAALGENRGHVIDTLAAVAEAEPKPDIALRLDAERIDYREVIRHRGPDLLQRQHGPRPPPAGADTGGRSSGAAVSPLPRETVVS